MQMKTKSSKGDDDDDLLCQLSGGHVERDTEDEELLATGTSDDHLPQQSLDIVLADVPGTLPFWVIISCRCDGCFRF